MFVGDRYFSQSAGIKCMIKAKSEQGWMTPQDMIRYADKNELSILFDDSDFLLKTIK